MARPVTLDDLRNAEDEIEREELLAQVRQQANPSREELERACKDYQRGLLTDEEFAAEVVEIVHG